MELVNEIVNQLVSQGDSVWTREILCVSNAACVCEGREGTRPFVQEMKVNHSPLLLTSWLLPNW